MDTPHIFTLAVLLALFGANTGLQLVIGRVRGIHVCSVPGTCKKEKLYNDAANVSGYRRVSLAADNYGKRVFYSEPDGQSFKINTLKYDGVWKKGRAESPTLSITSPIPVSIRSMAYDSNTLYWTNMRNPSIWKCELNQRWECSATMVKNVTGEDPSAIAVHNRYLFWTNNDHTSPSITAMNLDDESKTFNFNNSTLFMPNGLAIDTNGSRIYWIDDSEGDRFQIESAKLDGTDQKLEYLGWYQNPNDLTISDSTPPVLYWTDRTSDSVWQLDLGNRNNGAIRMLKTDDYGNTPMGVVAINW